jgi:Cys-tRNA(Pro) deacylase
MSKEAAGATPAAQTLVSAGIPFSEHFFVCEERSSTEVCAKQLNVDEHAVVKTILLEADGKPFMVLMHGDMRASAKELGLIMGAKSITPCMPDKAEEYTGYEVGEASPFGTRIEMPVYMEETILNLRKIYVKGGKRGYMVGLDPYDLVKILHPTLVKVAGSRAA